MESQIKSSYRFEVGQEVKISNEDLFLYGSRALVVGCKQKGHHNPINLYEVEASGSRSWVEEQDITEA